MKRTLREVGLVLDYRGLSARYAGDGLEIAVTIPVPEGEDANVETRNKAKAEAIRKTKTLLGEGSEVEVVL